jgi:glycosyltransferase involved in cell wall biosynthesis
MPKKENVLVSVIITCYNLEKYISRAIGSCINQSLEDSKYEIIVVDDCSIDSSVDTIKGFDNLVDVLIVNDKNHGVAKSSNIGISAASGKYIVRVDGDDYINKNTLRTMSEILEWNEGIGFTYCDHIVVTENGSRRQDINTFDKLLDHGAGVMFRKRYLDLLGLYDENLRNREDYDLLLKYIRNFDGYHIRLPYYRYFKRDGSLSTLKEQREDLKKEIDERENVQ